MHKNYLACLAFFNFSTPCVSIISKLLIHRVVLFCLYVCTLKASCDVFHLFLPHRLAWMFRISCPCVCVMSARNTNTRVKFRCSLYTTHAAGGGPHSGAYQFEQHEDDSDENDDENHDENHDGRGCRQL